jgi:epoxyqueuosine reductase
VTGVDPLPHIDFYRAWLAQGYAGDMAYLHRHADIKADIRQLLPSAQSVIVVGCNYYTPNPEMPYQVARYAHGDDYHHVIKAMLDTLGERLQALEPTLEYRAFTDSGPLLERELAMRAGLGWIGKHTNLIHPRKGSWFLLGSLLTNLDIPVSPPFEKLHCGTCTRCIDACPTQAIVAPYTVDARRCIAYLTIETREEIPADMRPDIGDHLFGCDVCQDVCPWNQRFQTPTPHESFYPRAWLQSKPLDELLLLTPHQFELQIAPRSAVKRPKYRGFIRNVAVVIGNSQDPHYLPALATAIERHTDDPMLVSHMQWAQGRLASL